jgi:AcrR family transcriptional regulator
MARTDTRKQVGDRADVTRARIVQAARELVTENGYAAVSTAQIQERAGISRGGLYHHFTSRQELVGAVIEAIEVDLAVRMAAAVADAPDPFTALATGVQWYLDECLRSEELQRIGLYEGRQAMGWRAWHETVAPRETVAPYGFGMLVAVLDAAVDAGELPAVDCDALALMILALLHEAATMMLNAQNPLAERARVGATVAVIIDGLRTR